ncbi:MAG: SIR2 family protein [Malacoplasma sp.]|nr:SIR2 family protein [Malacoplasma sp.]
MLTYYDPSEKINEIKQLLVSDKKKIGFLFGAGSSLSKKCDNSPYIPAISEMTKIAINKLGAKDKKYFDIINSIKTDITDSGESFNIETLLSNIEGKISIIGKGNLNGLDKSGFIRLGQEIRDAVREIVSVHKDIKADRIKDMAQYDFGLWIKNAYRKYAVEIFTPNYDYLLEIGLEQNNVPYYDGFTGSYKPFFNSDSVEDIHYLPQQTKLWKIHGSLGLHQDSNDNRIIRSTSDKDDLLIYPSVLKYSNSKKQPYASFMDRLNSFLKQDDTVLFVCGYSFSDEHINERIMSALQTDTTAHVYVLNYDLIINEDGSCTSLFSDESNLAKLAKSCSRLSILSTRKAIFGSRIGTWQLKRRPDKLDEANINYYFNLDASAKGKEQSDDEIWTGTGELTIVDFARFTKFLLNMIPEDKEKTENE